MNKDLVARVEHLVVLYHNISRFAESKGWEWDAAMPAYHVDGGTYAQALFDLWEAVKPRPDSVGPHTGKHTPGPWQYHSGFVMGRFHTDSEVHDVCDPLCAPLGCTAEMAANTHLILAAPDMLEALKDFVAAGTMECCCGQTPCCGSCTITMAKKAIAKAEGKGNDMPDEDKKMMNADKIIENMKALIEMSDAGNDLQSQGGPGLSDIEDMRRTVSEYEGKK